jgi:hypothetical protein
VESRPRAGSRKYKATMMGYIIRKRTGIVEKMGKSMVGFALY